jgi:hypothetical protein
VPVSKSIFQILSTNGSLYTLLENADFLHKHWAANMTDADQDDDLRLPGKQELAMPRSAN